MQSVLDRHRLYETLNRKQVIVQEPHPLLLEALLAGELKGLLE